jgi:hypothetical protein
MLRSRMPAAQGLIVRLPKLLDDPAWEVMPVPDTLGLPDFLAALRLWRWQRHMEGRAAGTRPHPPHSSSASAEAIVHAG